MGNCIPKREKKMPTERIFAVSVLNDKKEVQASGKLTVTTEHMSLQNNGAETNALWELKGLRRFGFDSNVFSFEAGRKCRDGPGIWAFSTPEAEDLFKMVDYYINKSKEEGKFEGADNTNRSSKDKHLGGTVVKSDYAGVQIGDGAKNGIDAMKTKSAYAQLDLSKGKFKIPGSTGGGSGDKKTKTAYAELDYDKMQEQAQSGATPTPEGNGTILI